VTPKQPLKMAENYFSHT